MLFAAHLGAAGFGNVFLFESQVSNSTASITPENSGGLRPCATCSRPVDDLASMLRTWGCIHL
jgi:hypothetical protein